MYLIVLMFLNKLMMMMLRVLVRWSQVEFGSVACRRLWDAEPVDMEGFDGSNYAHRSRRHFGLTETASLSNTDHRSQTSRSPSNTSGSVRGRCARPVYRDWYINIYTARAFRGSSSRTVLEMISFDRWFVAVKCGRVETFWPSDHRPVFTAMIENNRFRNCLIARHESSTFYASLCVSPHRCFVTLHTRRLFFIFLLVQTFVWVPRPIDVDSYLAFVFTVVYPVIKYRLSSFLWYTGLNRYRARVSA